MRINKKFHIIVAGISLVSCLPNLGVDESALKFDSLVWSSADKIDGTREMMLGSLYDSILLKGADKDSVVYYLGAADSTYGNQDWYLVSVSHDPCYLIINYESGVLIDAEKECW
jgi:hypothetical protein